MSSSKTRRLSRAVLPLLLLSSLCLGQPSSLSSLGRAERPIPLPLEQAFPFYVAVVDDSTLQVTWTPANGHYLYRHAFDFSLQNDPRSAPVSLDFELPEGLHKTDQFFGDIEAYYGTVSATLKLPPQVGSEAIIWLEYQGCAEWGFCYPPQRADFALQP